MRTVEQILEYHKGNLVSSIKDFEPIDAFASEKVTVVFFKYTYNDRTIYVVRAERFDGYEDFWQFWDRSSPANDLFQAMLFVLRVL